MNNRIGQRRIKGIERRQNIGDKSWLIYHTALGRDSVNHAGRVTSGSAENGYSQTTRESLGIGPDRAIGNHQLHRLRIERIPGIPANIW